MEFTYSISEEEYVKANKLARKMMRSSIRKTVLFWLFVVVCLTLLFLVVQKDHVASQDPGSSTQTEETVQVQSGAPEVSTSVAAHNALVNIAPLAAVLGIWAGIFFFWIPYQVRRQYRRDPNYQGVMTVTLNADTVALRSTTGLSWQVGWNSVDRWRERNDFLLLQMKSRGFLFASVRNLSEPEREDLRTILAEALRKK